MKKVLLYSLCFVVSIFFLLTNKGFALTNDQVNSVNIAEADGTTGQDTNTGSGIKTGHIQDGAVTTVKLAANSVTASKIGFYTNVIIVALSGGDFTSPVDAINAITDASASNPYLVKIMPGVYNIGSNSLSMKGYVDIEGSGEKVTKITIDTPVVGSTNAEMRFLTIESSGNAIEMNNGVIANMTVTCNGGNRCVSTASSSGKLKNVTINTSADIGVYTQYNSPELTDVTINGTASGNAFLYGIYNSRSSPLLNNVTINVSGNASYGHTGIGGEDSSPIIRNTKIDASNLGYGISVYGNGSLLKIDQSEIKGDSRAILSKDFGDMYIANTKIDGAIVTFAPVKCINVFDGNYDPITCPQ